MAKYTVIHNCEHEEHLELFGPLKDRAYRLTQLRQRPCHDCQRTSHEGDNDEARVLSHLDGLPVLSGTPGQTAWAESIRRRLITQADAMIAAHAADPRAQEEPSIMAMWNARLEALRRQTSASWWIDTRGMSPQTVLTMAVS